MPAAKLIRCLPSGPRTRTSGLAYGPLTTIAPSLTSARGNAISAAAGLSAGSVKDCSAVSPAASCSTTRYSPPGKGSPSGTARVFVPIHCSPSAVPVTHCPASTFQNSSAPSWIT